jgi:DNA-directed RNA polymerase specialized sigma24 family protein
MTAQLTAFPPIATTGTAVTFRVAPVPSAPLAPGPWALWQGHKQLGKAGNLGQAVVAAFAQPGEVEVEARGGPPAGWEAQLVLEVVSDRAGELWGLLDLAPSSALGKEWRADLCRRFGGGPAALDEALARLRPLRETIAARVSDPANQARWLATRPLVRLPPDERENGLQQCVLRALRRGWQLAAPELFEPWFHGVRQYYLLDWFRGRGRDDAQELVWEPEAPAEAAPGQGLVVDQVVAVARALQAGKAPGRNGWRTAVEELREVLALREDERPAVGSFLQELRHASIHLLEMHALAFGQNRHALRLEAGPARAAAERLAADMAELAQVQEQKARARGPVAPTVPRFARMAEQVNRFEAEGLGLPRLALGHFFGPFAAHLPALRVLAPCRRLAKHLLGPPPRVPGLLAGLGDLLRRLDEGTWTFQIDAPTRDDLGQRLDAWRPVVERLPLAPDDQAAARLLLSWLMLGARRLDDRRWLGRVAACDRRWWVKHYQGGRAAEAAPDVEALCRDAWAPGSRREQ